MTPIPCGAAHPEIPDCYCNMVDGHAGPHYSAYPNTKWETEGDQT